MTSTRKLGRAVVDPEPLQSWHITVLGTRRNGANSSFNRTETSLLDGLLARKQIVKLQCNFFTNKMPLVFDAA